MSGGWQVAQDMRPDADRDGSLKSLAPSAAPALSGTVPCESPPGMVTTLFANVIWSAGAGLLDIGGTFAFVIPGACPGMPPRGMVRTTCDGGNGVPSARLAKTRSIACRK